MKRKKGYIMTFLCAILLSSCTQQPDMESSHNNMAETYRDTSIETTTIESATDVTVSESSVETTTISENEISTEDNTTISAIDPDETLLPGTSLELFGEWYLVDADQRQNIYYLNYEVPLISQYEYYLYTEASVETETIKVDKYMPMYAIATDREQWILLQNADGSKKGWLGFQPLEDGQEYLGVNKDIVCSEYTTEYDSLWAFETESVTTGYVKDITKFANMFADVAVDVPGWIQIDSKEDVIAFQSKYYECICTNSEWNERLEHMLTLDDNRIHYVFFYTKANIEEEQVAYFSREYVSDETGERERVIALLSEENSEETHIYGGFMTLPFIYEQSVKCVLAAPLP